MWYLVLFDKIGNVVACYFTEKTEKCSKTLRGWEGMKDPHFVHIRGDKNMAIKR